MIDEKILVERIMREYSTVPYRLVNPKIEDVKEQNAYMKCVKIVSQLAEESNNGWIPCSERLPKDKTDVLVWHSDQDMHCVAWYNSATKKWYSNDFGIADSEYIVAWQPLPPKYEPKEDKQK